MRICSFMYCMIVVLTVLLGCGQSIQTVIEEKLAGLSLRSESCAQMSRDICGEVCAMLNGQSFDVKTNALKSLILAFRMLPFDESSYEARSKSFDSYYVLTCFATERLRNQVGDPALAFDFKIEALDRINAEIERCMKEPKGGPYGNLMTAGGMGMLPIKMIQRTFVDALKRKRYDVVRDGFEHDRSFSEFFSSLSVFDQKYWKDRLEKIAHREVVVYDKRHPFVMPPPYVAEDSREWLPNEPGMLRKYVEHIGGGKVSIGHVATPPKDYDECVKLIHSAVDIRKNKGIDFFCRYMHKWLLACSWRNKDESRKLRLEFVKTLSAVDLSCLSADDKIRILHCFLSVHEFVSRKLVVDYGERQLAEDLLVKGFAEFKRMCFSFGDENDMSDGNGPRAVERRRLARKFRMAWGKDVEEFKRDGLDSIFTSESGGVSESFLKRWMGIVGQR